MLVVWLVTFLPKHFLMIKSLANRYQSSLSWSMSSTGGHLDGEPVWQKLSGGTAGIRT